MQPYSPTRSRNAALLLSLLSSSTLLVPLAAAATTTASGGGGGTSYADQVCKPVVPDGSTLPPCVEIENIQVACSPNGTAPVDYEAHAQCMCHGSFFQEWTACRQCLYVHGQLSERDIGYWQSAIGLASSSLCGFLAGGGSPPTAAFQDIFTAAQAQASVPATGATATSDRAPSDTAISLYFTPSGSLGPGSITGSAASATQTGSGAGNGSGGGSNSGSATTSGGSSGQSGSGGSSQQTTQMNSGGSQTTAASTSQTSSKTSGGVAISAGSGTALLGAAVGLVFSLL